MAVRASIRIFLAACIPAALIVFCPARPSNADPVWGTTMPGQTKWIVGFRHNILFDDDLTRQYGDLESTQYFCDISIGITDWLSIDGRLGLGNLHHDAGNTFDIDYGMSFAGGYGGRLRVLDLEERKVKGVLGFQHISVHPPTKDIGAEEHRAISDSWQFSGVISREFKYAIPYLGITLARDDLIEWVDNYRKRKKGRGPFVGLAVGSDVKLTEALYINVEGRFFDETSLSSALLWRF